MDLASDYCDTAVSALDLSHRLLHQLQMAKVSKICLKRVGPRLYGTMRLFPSLCHHAYTQVIALLW